MSTSLPTIVSDLGASQDQYTWVAVAYMLTQTAGQPLYGKFSDLIGRKVRKPQKASQICVETTGPGGPLHEHVYLLYWFTFVWRIQGDPNCAISGLVTSRLFLHSPSHG